MIMLVTRLVTRHNVNLSRRIAGAVQSRDQELYDFKNKCVFSCFLKLAIGSGLPIMSNGGLFQTVSAAWQKA